MNKERKEAEVSRNLFLSLSKSLRIDLFIEMYGRILSSNKVFEANFSKAFINSLTSKVREVKYVPDDIIYFQNETETPEIYFVIKGAVDVGVLRNERGK